MERLTRKKDQYPCRMAGGCPAENWIAEEANVRIYDLGNVCDKCPFEKYINALAEYEDKMEEELK